MPDPFLKDLIKRRDAFQKQVEACDVMIESLQSLEGGSKRGRGKKGHHTMSASARKKIAKAQKLRWAKVKQAEASKA